jgi:cysteine-rich CPXCG protein
LTDINGEDEPWLDEEFPLGDGIADVDTLVTCPYCGEEVEIGVDPGGGSDQSYVEDCPVCCSPWLVKLRYVGGTVEVTLTQTEA